MSRRGESRKIRLEMAWISPLMNLKPSSTSGTTRRLGSHARSESLLCDGMVSAMRCSSVREMRKMFRMCVYRSRMNFSMRLLGERSA